MPAAQCANLFLNAQPEDMAYMFGQASQEAQRAVLGAARNRSDSFEPTDLNAIIEDLLLLSRLEEGNGKPTMTREDCPVREVLTAAEADTYTFTVSPGDKVLVRMTRSAGNLWPGVQIYAPGGLKICEHGSSVTAERTSIAWRSSAASRFPNRRRPRCRTMPA